MDKSMWTSYFMESTPEEAVRLLADKGWRTVELSTEHSQTLLDRGNAAATARDFLREVGFDGPFNFEIPGESRCPVPQRLEKLDTAARIASTLLANPGVR